MGKSLNPRLGLALAGQLLPEGTVLVLSPVFGQVDLSPLPREQVLIVTPLKPDHDAFAAQGFAVSPTIPEGCEAAAAVVFIPRSRDAARGLIAEAASCLPEGAPIWIDGAKTDGIDSLLREIRGFSTPGEPLAKAHGKIFQLPATTLPDSWEARDICPAPGFVTRPGVFSADAPDRGSCLLAEALPARLPARVADLGAGWGWLSAQILARDGVETLDLVEADHRALECARRNISDPRARFVWADALRHEADPRYGAVIMNPPFHQGRAGDPGLGVAFIRAAASMLSLSGTLFLVANRHLPYEQALQASFHEIEEVGGDGGFKLIRAAKPMTAQAAARRAAQTHRPSRRVRR